MKKITLLAFAILIPLHASAEPMSLEFHAEDGTVTISIEDLPKNNENNSITDLFLKASPPEYIQQLDVGYDVELSQFIQAPGFVFKEKNIFFELSATTMRLRLPTIDVLNTSIELRKTPTPLKRNVSFTGRSAESLYELMRDKLGNPQGKTFKEMLTLDPGLENETSVRCAPPHLNPQDSTKYRCSIGGN